MRTIILRVYGEINLEDSGSNIHSRPPPDALRLPGKSAVKLCRPVRLISINAAAPAPIPAPAVVSVQTSPCGSSSESIVVRMSR